ncbi:aspartyl-phosphate phosphatase Spo0E family protein [Clostridium akagii]|uniref:aspartyl-phosphate phosphatase Spo0E family protein n=1 Tax=Clostridium akagii TaxID=91623 RepID=UPI000559FF39|nr:aspartyl-phosphate phosphatase Spo0E family protein [Clostridium akagii]
MNPEMIGHINNDELKNDINELRDVLNEMCALAENAEDMEKIVVVSQQMDTLIVKYMIEEYKYLQVITINPIG